MNFQNVSLSPSIKSEADKLTREDIPQLYNRLEQVAAQVQRKSMASVKSSNTSHFSNWAVLRPYMSRDFIEDPPGSPVPPPLHAIPFQSQENILIEDLLSCMDGFQGKYITAQPLQNNYDPRTFIVCESVDSSLRLLVLQILPLATNYSIITRFIQEKRQMGWGRVNQALTAALDTVRDDFVVFIAQLETQHRRQQLNLHKMWFYLQSSLSTMQTLANIVTTINNARGAQTLSLLHEETRRCLASPKAQNLCMELTRAAAVPYFQSLQQWLHKGIVFDPCGEFMIEDNVSVEKDMNKVTGLYSDEYWTQRYKIKKDNVPEFLYSVQEYILRTGKYLNVVRQCSENSNISEPPIEQLVYTMRGEQYLTIIDKAYQYASAKLLDILLTNYDIINRIKSLKRYFLMEQGDFIVQLLDLCEEELEKNIKDVAPNRLQTLLEVALRTSCGKFDPYKEDVHLTILRQNNTYQIYKIQSIGKEAVLEYMQGESQQSKTGLEGFAFQITSKWPLSLLFNEKVIGCYQMLFRHLLYCKHVDRKLCRVWICDKAVKILPRQAALGYLSAFSLRSRMLFCVQNLEYYMMEEAIEPNWIRFTQRLVDVKNIDDLLAEHWNFLEQCMKDCMFYNHKLIRTIKKILATCIEFCDFIQRMQKYFMDAELTSMISHGAEDTESCEDIYGQDITGQNQSFEQNISRLDATFKDQLVILLRSITYLGRDESVEKLCNILYREDFNNYYSEYLDDYARLPSEIDLATG